VNAITKAHQRSAHRGREKKEEIEIPWCWETHDYYRRHRDTQGGSGLDEGVPEWDPVWEAARPLLPHVGRDLWGGYRWPDRPFVAVRSRRPEIMSTLHPRSEERMSAVTGPTGPAPVHEVVRYYLRHFTVGPGGT
jgi:hypothetical protein